MTGRKQSRFDLLPRSYAQSLLCLDGKGRISLTAWDSLPWWFLHQHVIFHRRCFYDCTKEEGVYSSFMGLNFCCLFSLITDYIVNVPKGRYNKQHSLYTEETIDRGLFWALFCPRTYEFCNNGKGYGNWTEFPETQTWEPKEK